MTGRETRLAALIERSKAAVRAMSPDERAEMFRLQRESFVRGMSARCEHGEVDFEQCPKCRGWT